MRILKKIWLRVKKMFGFETTNEDDVKITSNDIYFSMLDSEVVVKANTNATLRPSGDQGNVAYVRAALNVSIGPVTTYLENGGLVVLNTTGLDVRFYILRY